MKSKIVLPLFLACLLPSIALSWTLQTGSERSGDIKTISFGVNLALSEEYSLQLTHQRSTDDAAEADENAQALSTGLTFSYDNLDSYFFAVSLEKDEDLLGVSGLGVNLSLGPQWFSSDESLSRSLSILLGIKKFEGDVITEHDDFLNLDVETQASFWQKSWGGEFTWDLTSFLSLGASYERFMYTDESDLQSRHPSNQSLNVSRTLTGYSGYPVEEFGPYLTVYFCQSFHLNIDLMRTNLVSNPDQETYTLSGSLRLKPWRLSLTPSYSITKDSTQESESFGLSLRLGF